MAQRVTDVGVIAFIDSPEQHRRRLQRWQALDGVEHLPDAVIDREVERHRSADSLQLRFRAVAKLADGRRIESEGDAGSSGIVVALTEGEPVPDIRVEYEAMAQRGAEEMARETNWVRSELVQAFAAAGIEVDAGQLSSVSVRAEVDWDSVGSYLDRMAT
jgi:hypothetical protein